MTTSASTGAAAAPARSSRSALQDVAMIAVFAALIIVLAFVSIPVGAAGVPIVLQNAAIILAGLVLGGRRGFLAAGLFLLLGMIGIPVLAGGRTTLSALAGPTIGYLVGYLLSALVAGLIAYRFMPKKNRAGATFVLAIAALVALVVQYLSGSIGMVFRADLTFPQAIIAQGAFVLPDLAKVAVMVVIAAGVHAAFPDMRRNRW